MGTCGSICYQVSCFYLRFYILMLTSYDEIPQVSCCFHLSRGSIPFKRQIVRLLVKYHSNADATCSGTSVP